VKEPTDGWGRWSVVLCKPDAVRRGLVEVILSDLSTHLELVARREVIVTKAQIFTHYADMIALDAKFPFDVATELRRNYVGQHVTVALGHGTHDDTPQRIRALLGHYDPARADPASIRGRYGIDSLTAARTEGRFIDNLIHTSDDPEGAEREFRVWFGPDYLTLLSPQPEQEHR
jgi:nucleoside-diphosphate kinase